MSTVIKVEDLSKQYRLGDISTGALSHDINRLWYKIRGKENPYLKIGETNDRTSKGESQYVWALKDINFDVKQGEVLGIIGRNGAGKSTLLKILSRTTSPTTGSVKIKGRVASLLEVGTGFHPELSGRENIYLNGAILGMTKTEIKRKFDEIVDFAGVERYIDTPVKRYSSGMYVRLAFGVAAHLESEILIVDEVLAVGDAEFQKKCLGKMNDISKGEGRTVLFVSHNLSAVESLCTKGIYIKTGLLNYMGDSKDTIITYLEESKKASRTSFNSHEKTLGNEKIKIVSGSVTNADAATKLLDVTMPVKITFNLINLSNDPVISICLDIHNLKGEILFSTGGLGTYAIGNEISASCIIPANFLNDGYYSIYIYIHNKNMSLIFEQKDILEFEVKDIERENGYLGKINGIVRPKLNWQIQAV